MEIETTLSPLKRFLNLLKVDKQEILSIYVYALFNGLVALSLPLGIQAIINLITGGQVSTSWIMLVIIVIAGVAFAGVMQIMQLTITENLQQKIFARSAFEFAYRIPRMQLQAVDKKHIPELINRFFDTFSVQKGLSKILLDFSTASLQVVFGLILLSLYHPFFILFSLLLVFFVYLIFRLTAPKGLKTSLIESKYKYEVAHWLEELARAHETFKLAGNSPLPMNNTDLVVTGYIKSRKEHFKTLRIQYINLVALKVIIAAGLLVIGGLLVINQQMNIGQFVASEIIIILVLGSVEKLIVSMETIYDVLTAIEKVGTITDIPLERDNGMNIAVQPDTGFSISMENLNIAFDDSEYKQLLNINLEIKAGEKICISGENGSGKSLLLQVLSGMYDNITGILAFNNVPLGNWNKEELYGNLGDSLSSEDIFKGTVLENITLGRSIDFKEVQDMVNLLDLTKHIETLPLGYDTMLLPGGKTLPKTMKIKILLARSVVTKPKLILIEDNFNQISYHAKNQFLDYILSLNATVIVASNDPVIAQRFDQVIVLQKGEIIGKGTVQSIKQNSWFNKVFKTN